MYDDDDDTTDIFENISPFAVASLYHDMAKLLKVGTPSSQLAMTKEDKDLILSMAGDNDLHPELEDVCNYIQKHSINDLTSMLT